MKIKSKGKYKLCNSEKLSNDQTHMCLNEKD